MNKKLRSNFVRGTSPWAVRRAQWRALGFTDEDMEKPKIAVVNTSSKLAICFSHLDGVAEKVSEAIRAAGGLPLEVRTAAPSDFITSPGRRGGYILSARDLVTNDIEVVVEGAQLDGMVCLTSCDKTVPGHLMAAARLNIPTLMVVCGYQPSGEYKGEHCDIEEVFLAAGHTAAGKLPVEELADMADVSIKGPGVCSGMGTANSMHIATEALGMCLPGTAPVAANSDKMFADVAAAGKRIVEMVEEDLRPRDIMTPEAFSNSAMSVLAVSGSINCIKHLQAVAVEAGMDLNVYDLFDKLSDKVPVLAAVRPNGEDSIEAFEAAGGARAVMKQLGDLVNADAMTVSGKTMGENLVDATVGDQNVIRSRENAFSHTPPIVIVRGSLAPGGAIIKLGISQDRVFEMTGPARAFDTADEALDCIRNKGVKAGEVVVLKGLGLKGGPGMSTASRVVFALDGAGLGEEVAVVSDGQNSGLVNRGLVVGEVEPEAAIGGPLGLVEDGDIISIDARAKTVDLKVSEEELARRRERFQVRTSESGGGWLKIYQETVQPLSSGAVLTKRS